ncbi:MAG: ABC transporter ATP-binding protein [Saprospirales bacterium]|nr:MAG: ABC transporter ATP-binding protein [Saprospirales bacterium]
MISISNLSKRFGKLQVLKSMELDFERGVSYAMMGPNGSGKTTLIKCILGLVVPDKGRILVNGTDIKGSWAYRSDIGYMPQIGRYPDHMRIGQLFDMIQNIRKDKTDFDLDLVKLFQLDQMLDKPMRTLSGGTRQKVSAALAFMFDPGIYILDEPTAGLDPLAVEALKEKIAEERERGKLIIITSHILSDLDELTSHAIYLFEGNIFYNNNIDELKKETGEERFSSAIARLMEWSQKGSHVKISKNAEIT